MSEIVYPVEHSSGSVWTASGELLCDCPGGGDDDRRIAAALNATQNFDTDQLVRCYGDGDLELCLGMNSGIWSRCGSTDDSVAVADENTSLRAVNAELLAALEETVDALWSALSNSCDEATSGWHTTHEDIAKAARAAIAKASEVTP